MSLPKDLHPLAKERPFDCLQNEIAGNYRLKIEKTIMEIICAQKNCAIFCNFFFLTY